MKYTLLDLVQTVLSSIDGDEVDSISDTIESQQVAKIIRTCYFDIVSPTDLPEHFSMINLNGTSSSTPTVLTRPDGVDFIEYFHYNVRTSTDTEDNWREINYVEPDEFLYTVRHFDQSQSTTQSFNLTANGYTTKIYYENDRAPKIWTSFDDQKVICDAIDTGVESSLQSSKTSCRAKLIKTFTLSDSFIPDLDEQQFPLLLNESKALAWAELKQAQHGKAEKLSRMYRTKIERNKKDLPGKDGWGNSLPNYGRHR